MEDVCSSRKRERMSYGDGEVSVMAMAEYHLRRAKWVKHYSSFHKILLVGEGDFSFSLSLALGFGSASNIWATSLDSCEDLLNKYGRAGSILMLLSTLGATLSHEVDATKMKHFPQFNDKKFDRIVFNFPHAGFHGKEDNPRMIKMHKDLVRGFFSNARWLLQHNGEVHVSHKNAAPYCDWNLKELAHESGLQFLECVPFNTNDYLVYQNKRGQGPASDDTFNLGDCSTFKFIASPHFTDMANNFSNHMISRDLFIPKETCLSYYWPHSELEISSRIYPFQLKFVVKGSVGLYPDTARYTGALMDSQKRDIAFISGPLFVSHMDHNVAELLAIKNALLMFERSNLCGKAFLVVETDSNYAVSCIKLNYPITYEAQPIVHEITMALRRIGGADICCSFGDHGVVTHYRVVHNLEMLGFDLNSALELRF